MEAPQTPARHVEGDTIAGGPYIANLWPTAVALISGGGMFWDGLYSEDRQALAAAALAVTALAGRWTAHRGARSIPLLASPVAAVLIALFGIAVVGSLWNPAAVDFALYGPVLATGWILAFLAGRETGSCGGRPAQAEGRQETDADLLVCRTWSLAAAALTVAGPLALWLLPPHQSGRMASLAGYPIAVGIFGLMGLICSLARPWRNGPLNRVLAYLGTVAVVVSGSRGVWLVAVPALLLQRKWLPDSGGLWRAGFAAAMAWGWATAVWLGPLVATRRSGLAAVLLGVGIGLVLLQQWPAGAGRSRGLVMAGPVLLAAVVGLAALVLGPPWLAGRVAGPGSATSITERIAFLVDGWRIVVGHPVGAGWRGWQELHQQFASYDYYTAQVHSSVLDMAISFGYLGGAAFLGLCGWYFLGILRLRQVSAARGATLLAGAALLAHSLVDWTLSLGALMTAAWYCLGLMDGTLAASTRQSLRPLIVPRRAVMGLAIAAALGGVALWMGINVTDTAYANALRRSDLAMRLARWVTRIQPWSFDAHVLLAHLALNTGDDQAARSHAELAWAVRPHNPAIGRLRAQVLMKVGDWPRAMIAYRRLPELTPWWVPAYEHAVTELVAGMRRLEAAGDSAGASRVRAAAKDILAQLDERKRLEPPRPPRGAINIRTPVLEDARSALGALEALPG